VSAKGGLLLNASKCEIEVARPHLSNSELKLIESSRPTSEAMLLSAPICPSRFRNALNHRLYQLNCYRQTESFFGP